VQWNESLQERKVLSDLCRQSLVEYQRQLTSFHRQFGDLEMMGGVTCNEFNRVCGKRGRDIEIYAPSND
jgi:hypothetical protein